MQTKDTFCKNQIKNLRLQLNWVCEKKKSFKRLHVLAESLDATSLALSLTGPLFMAISFALPPPSRLKLRFGDIKAGNGVRLQAKTLVLEL